MWQENSLKTERTIPAERIEGQKEHSIHLSGQALDILKSLPAQYSDETVF